MGSDGRMARGVCSGCVFDRVCAVLEKGFAIMSIIESDVLRPVITEALAELSEHSGLGAGTVDVELLCDAIRLGSGMFTGRLHILAISVGEDVTHHRLVFNSPMCEVEFSLAVKQDGSYTVRF